MEYIIVGLIGIAFFILMYENHQLRKTIEVQRKSYEILRKAYNQERNK